MRGSYATFDGKDAWIGTWTKDEPEVARMFRLDSRLFDDYDGKAVQEERSVESIPVPLEAQGAAFDKAGNLWVSASNGKWGKLHRLDRQGKVLAPDEMTAGLEDLAVDEAGALWGLSESGTRKYLHWGRVSRSSSGSRSTSCVDAERWRRRGVPSDYNHTRDPHENHCPRPRRDPRRPDHRRLRPDLRAPHLRSRLLSGGVPGQ